MTEQASQTASQELKSSFGPIGFKHIIAIVFAVGITLGIFLMRDQIERFKELAYLGAFLVMLLTSATVILPAPGIVFVFALGAQLNPLLVGLASGPGAALGELTGYLAGYGTSAVFNETPLFRKFSEWVGGRFGLGFIALLAFIPNPIFDMAGLVSGTLGVKWWKFLLATLIGKTTRMILVAYGGALSLEWVERVFL